MTNSPYIEGSPLYYEFIGVNTLPDGALRRFQFLEPMHRIGSFPHFTLSNGKFPSPYPTPENPESVIPIFQFCNSYL